MNRPAEPRLEPGRVYRTGDFRAHGKNPSRMLSRLVERGDLVKAAHGLFYAPVMTRAGPLPPSDDALLRALLNGEPFVITGPDRWNALGFGPIAPLPCTLVYNHQRTGEFAFTWKCFQLRRRRFPDHAPREWFAVDLLQHHALTGVPVGELGRRVVAELRRRKLRSARLLDLAARYGTRPTQELVELCVEVALGRV